MTFELRRNNQADLPYKLKTAILCILKFITPFKSIQASTLKPTKNVTKAADLSLKIDKFKLSFFMLTLKI
jgi:hypothetical protein